jgi:hypothetical protein
MYFRLNGEMADLCKYGCRDMSNIKNSASDVSGFFKDHRISHSARPPDTRNIKYEDELRQIGKEEGLFEFVSPPVIGIPVGKAPTSRADVKKANETKHLWVVAQNGLPAALEYPAKKTALQGDRLTHTNLTGGEDAHTAGELWFYDENSILINGGSSRYKPRSPEELMSVARSFKAAGYRVASMGWDESGPVRFMRGEPEWL